ncbi:hypothetical protein ZHAS_00021791 [Anopheles sinensis]|uniref:Uncharacterized protein n=1 Tax=Anopheles sinensis TaxID=74873 RepID=A0A084WTL4_ANOSI|nr:hypothetical protein ZHAS_00021791 [Anopheles sinensis]
MSHRLEKREHKKRPTRPMDRAEEPHARPWQSSPVLKMTLTGASVRPLGAARLTFLAQHNYHQHMVPSVPLRNRVPEELCLSVV